MPLSPLFVPTYSKLTANLRLSGTAQSDPVAIIDEAIQAARVALYDHLGEDQVNRVKAVTYTDTPTNPEDRLLIKACLCETAMIRVWLMRRLPLLFMDSSATARDNWQEDGLTRYASADLEKEIARADTEIADWLVALSGDQTPQSSLNVATMGPLTVQPRPGDSISFIRGGIFRG